MLYTRIFTGGPPLLVQRCNDTTAGLSYLEVNVICPCKSPHWAVNYRVSALRTVDPHWGEWHNFSADFNPNHNHINAAPNKQVSRPPHVYTTMQPPKQNYCMYHVLVSITICEIKNKKEWHWPPNIIKTYLYNVTFVSSLRALILFLFCGCMVYHLLLLQLQIILFVVSLCKISCCWCVYITIPMLLFCVYSHIVMSVGPWMFTVFCCCCVVGCYTWAAVYHASAFTWCPVMCIYEMCWILCGVCEKHRTRKRKEEHTFLLSVQSAPPYPCLLYTAIIAISLSSLLVYLISAYTS